MHEINLMAAFASYKVKAARRARSAMTAEGDLVFSCWYAGFKKAQTETLRYEEDLSGQTGDLSMALRAHLAEALKNGSDVRVIVASSTAEKKEDSSVTIRTSYYARRDLVGLVSSFDGERLVIDFRKELTAQQARLSKGAALTRRAGSARH